MRRGSLFIALLVLAGAPTLASAAVMISVESVIPDRFSAPGDTIVQVDVFAIDLDGSDERLNAYTVAIDGIGFAPDDVRFEVPSGSSFGTAGRPARHPYVFKDMETIPPIENFGSTYNRLQFGAVAIGQDEEVNIDSTHNGLIRFSVIVPKNPARAVYPLVVDPRALSLAGLGAPIVATPGAPGTITIFIPEPSAAALLLVPSLALLRRWRGAAFRHRAGA